MKKKFVLSAITIAASLIISGCNDSDSDSESNEKSPPPDFIEQPRITYNINENWSYQMNYGEIEATEINFDDSGAEWENINLPHSIDAERVVNVKPGSSHFKGMNTYRKTLSMSVKEGKRQYLEFDGSALLTTVYINGEKAGEHTDGFMRFRIDITDYIVNGENTIVIQVDNRPYDPEVHETAFLPMETSQDYTYYGGVYRDLRILEVADVGIDTEDYGSSGIYFMQTKTTDSSSEIYSNIRVRNKSDKAFSGQVRTIIQDADGQIVYTAISPAEVKANDVITVTSDFKLNNINLWDGVNDPYLYSIFVEVLDGETVVDQVEQPLGLRYFAFDADKGFLLNGKPYRLDGVAMHQDRDVVGWSTSKEMRKGDLDMIREMGAKSIRFSHYPHNIDTSEYSNEVGFLNYLELPIVNAYLTEAEHGTAGAEYLTSAKEQMRALIRQNFNFPSMAVVGNSNETGLGMPNTPANTEWLQELSDVIKEEFGERFGQEVPYRKSTMATIMIDQIGDQDWNTVEMPCHNRYFGWYIGKIDDVGGYIDDLKTAYPNLPFCMSEYGAGVSTLPDFATETPMMADHSSQWGNLYHEGYIKAYNQRDWIWGTYVWNMFDFSVATRDEGDTVGRNDKGLVKFDHITKKDQYYLYQANWSDVPMIQIVDKNLAEATSRAVKVYSTLDEITLSVNGKIVGTKQRRDNDENLPGVFVWSNEEAEDFFEENAQNSISVSGTKNNEILTDEFSRKTLPFQGTKIHSDKVAILAIGENEGAISHLPDGITAVQFKQLVTLDLGASWGNTPTDDSILKQDDKFEVRAGNGDIRTYTVQETNSLSTYRNAYSSLVYDFTDKDAIDTDMFDGDPATDAFGLPGFSSPFEATVSVDLGAVFFVDSVEPKRPLAAGNNGYTIQIKGDVLGTDKLPYTDAIDWRENAIFLNNGPQAIKRLELAITGTEWFIPAQGFYIPVVGFAEINVFGGLIKGEKLGIDYKARTFTLDGSIIDMDDLHDAITKVDSNGLVSHPVTLELLNNTGNEVTDLATLASIKVKQIRDGQTYIEVYTRK